MYKRGEYGQVARALLVLDALRGFRYGRELKTIAEDLRVSIRTVRRDIHELTDAGYQIEFVKLGNKAGARLIEESYSSIRLTRSERHTLQAVRGLFNVLKGTQLYDDIESIMEKLNQRLPPEERKADSDINDRFAYVPDGGVKDYTEPGLDDILNELQTGVLNRKVVRYAYKDSRGRRQRGHLAAYSMVLYKHGLYVVGRRLRNPEDGSNPPDDPYQNVGAFACERFSEAQHLRNQPFHLPTGYKLAELVQGAFGLHIGDPSRTSRVAVEFSAEKAQLVRGRSWHPTQEMTKLGNGAVRVEFDCVNTTPVVSWLLSWGPHALAIEPRNLVDAVREELLEAVNQYDG